MKYYNPLLYSLYKRNIVYEKLVLEHLLNSYYIRKHITGCVKEIWLVPPLLYYTSNPLTLEMCMLIPKSQTTNHGNKFIHHYFSYILLSSLDLFRLRMILIVIIIKIRWLLTNEWPRGNPGTPGTGNPPAHPIIYLFFVQFVLCLKRIINHWV